MWRNVTSLPTPSITSLSPYVSPTEYPLNTHTYGLMRGKKYMVSMAETVNEAWDVIDM